MIFSPFQLGIHSNNVCHRSVLGILKNSLQDCTLSETDDVHTSVQSEVRYKLIIDPSEDDSLVRLLFSHGVLERENTRLYICSDFPGDSQMRVSTYFRKYPILFLEVVLYFVSWEAIL